MQDEEATRELRDAAAAAERPVFDWDESASEIAAARIWDGFALGREALAAARPHRPGDARRHDGPAELRRAALAARPGIEARLGLPVSDEDLMSLGEARFKEGLEERLVSLTAHALSGKVVEDRRSLAMARERGVVARTVRHGMPRASTCSSISGSCGTSTRRAPTSSAPPRRCRSAGGKPPHSRRAGQSHRR